MLVVNMKNYTETSKGQAIRMAQASSRASKRYGVVIAIAPPTGMLSEMAGHHVTVFAQHLDNFGVGSTTGYNIPEIMKSMGVAGALINHSERRIPEQDIAALVGRLRGLGMISVVCARDIAETERYARLNPDYVAIELPELIGSGRAISRERPELVTGAADVVIKAGNTTRLLCGSGVQSTDDVIKAVELGSEGVLAASSIVRAEDPCKKIDEFAAAISETRGRTKTVRC
jgi:triosephosphate isomerase